MKYDKILIIEGVPHALVKDGELNFCTRCSLYKYCIQNTGCEECICDAVAGFAPSQYRFMSLSAHQLIESLNEHRAEKYPKLAQRELVPEVFNYKPEF